MAGKSNKGRNRRGSSNANNSSESVVSSNVSTKESKDNSNASEPITADANGVPVAIESNGSQPEVKEVETESSVNQTKQGKIKNQHSLSFVLKTKGRVVIQTGIGILRLYPMFSSFILCFLMHKNLNLT